MGVRRVWLEKKKNEQKNEKEKKKKNENEKKKKRKRIGNKKIQLNNSNMHS